MVKDVEENSFGVPGVLKNTTQTHQATRCPEIFEAEKSPKI